MKLVVSCSETVRKSLCEAFCRHQDTSAVFRVKLIAPKPAAAFLTSATRFLRDDADVELLFRAGMSHLEIGGDKRIYQQLSEPAKRHSPLNASILSATCVDYRFREHLTSLPEGRVLA
jgi:hypothetical protein